MTHEPTEERPHHSTSLRLWLDWATAAAVAAPIAIILHELGHFGAARAFGFPDVALHYDSVGDGAAEVGFPLWQQGLEAAAGPLVTLLLVVACCYAALRVGPKPWAIAPAFAAGVRSVGIGAAYLIVRVRYPGAGGNFDELNVARRLGLTAEIVVGANVVLILGAWARLIRRVRPERRLVRSGKHLDASQRRSPLNLISNNSSFDAFSSSITFQIYTQALLSSGDYVRYRQLAAPGTYSFRTFTEGTATGPAPPSSSSGSAPRTGARRSATSTSAATRARSSTCPRTTASSSS